MRSAVKTWYSDWSKVESGRQMLACHKPKSDRDNCLFMSLSCKTCVCLWVCNYIAVMLSVSYTDCPTTCWWSQSGTLQFTMLLRGDNIYTYWKILNNRKLARPMWSLTKQDTHDNFEKKSKGRLIQLIDSSIKSSWFVVFCLWIFFCQWHCTPYLYAIKVSAFSKNWNIASRVCKNESGKFGQPASYHQVVLSWLGWSILLCVCVFHCVYCSNSPTLQAAATWDHHHFTFHVTNHMRRTHIPVSCQFLNPLPSFTATKAMLAVSHAVVCLYLKTTFPTLIVHHTTSWRNILFIWPDVTLWNGSLQAIHQYSTPSRSDIGNRLLICDTRIDAAAMHLLSAKQGDILWVPGVKCLDRRTNLASHVGNLPCIE